VSSGDFSSSTRPTFPWVVWLDTPLVESLVSDHGAPHSPTGGSCLIFDPHMWVWTRAGRLGKVERRGIHGHSAAEVQPPLPVSSRLLSTGKCSPGGERRCGCPTGVRWRSSFSPYGPVSPSHRVECRASVGSYDT
jgi:hypothetical protein